MPIMAAVCSFVKPVLRGHRASSSEPEDEFQVRPGPGVLAVNVQVGVVFRVPAEGEEEVGAGSDVLDRVAGDALKLLPAEDAPLAAAACDAGGGGVGLPGGAGAAGQPEGGGCQFGPLHL